MGPHDVEQVEDGCVVCACGRTFSDNTTEEALARHRRHHSDETIGKPGLAEARQALKEGRDGS